VEQGGELQTHEDVPEDIREQFYAEEQQQLERRQRATNMSATTYPPINITNVLPAQSPQPSMMASSAETPASDPPSHATSAHRLDIPGLRDVAVNEYSDWQQSKVNDEILKIEFRRARDVALADGLDLEQVYEDQDPEFFITHGVKRGIARRFVSDIEDWVKRYKRNVDIEEYA
jgi:hypothetical protein